jgi:hypothetical protein
MIPFSIIFLILHMLSFCIEVEKPNVIKTPLIHNLDFASYLHAHKRKKKRFWIWKTPGMQIIRITIGTSPGKKDWNLFGQERQVNKIHAHNQREGINNQGKKRAIIMVPWPNIKLNGDLTSNHWPLSWKLVF